MNIQDLIKHTEKKKPNNNLVSKHHCFRPGEEKKNHSLVMYTDYLMFSFQNKEHT